MSDEPLTARNTSIIVACAHQDQAYEAILKYGPDVTAQVTMRIVVTGPQAASAVNELPAETPWTIMAGAAPAVIATLQTKFGAARAFAYCIEAQNNEYAIHPSKLNT